MRTRHAPLCLAAVFALISSPPVRGAAVGDACGENPILLGVTANSHYQLARSANIGWVRLDTRWNEVNPSPNVWNFTGLDNRINGAVNNGLKVLAILSTAPQWAGSNANGTTPPSNISLWEEFVRRTAQRYWGKVVAYEVWNEPNLVNDGLGIGWNQNLSQSPRYVDYLRAAALQIRTYAPGTLVVAPVTSSRPNSRTVEIYKQIEQTSFPEGPASSFLDVVSFHANGGNDSTGEVITSINSHLSTLSVRNPSNRNKPIWITEFGWRSAGIGETEQKNRIKFIVDGLMGSFSYCEGYNQYNFTNAFIFKLRDEGGSDGIYRDSGAAKQVVTSYTRSFPFPARSTGLGNVPFSYSCSGRTCTFVSSSTATIPQEFRWSFNDGSSTATGKTVQHSFPRSGYFFVNSVIAGDFSWLFGRLSNGSDTRLLQIP